VRELRLVIILAIPDSRENAVFVRKTNSGDDCRKMFMPAEAFDPDLFLKI
jgi:hypothetical protein